MIQVFKLRWISTYPSIEFPPNALRLIKDGDVELKGKLYILAEKTKVFFRLLEGYHR